MEVLKSNLDEQRQAISIVSARTILRNLAEEWTWQNIRNQRPRVSFDELRQDYVTAMDAMMFIAEDERFNLLQFYSRSLGISDNRSSKEQQNFYKTLVLIEPFTNDMFIDNSLFPFTEVFMKGGYERNTVAAALYLKSHNDLGRFFPRYSTEITENMCNYLANPEVSKILMTKDGKLGLVALITAHAKFLVPAEEVNQVDNPYAEYVEEESGSWLDDILVSDGEPAT